MCFKFLDTDREKEIEIGSSWPFAKLNPYECIVPSTFASKGLSVGSKIRIQLWLSAIWDNMRFAYNKVADENGWGEWPYARGEPFIIEEHQTIGYTDFECTVVAMIDERYGKMPKKDSDL